jgi:hypothetical protein
MGIEKTAGRQPVEVGCGGKGIAVTSEERTVVLAGYPEYVGPGRRFFRPVALKDQGEKQNQGQSRLIHYVRLRLTRVMINPNSKQIFLSALIRSGIDFNYTSGDLKDSAWSMA